MESSPEPTRPSKRVKYEQHDDTIQMSIPETDIRASESINGSLVADVPFFDNPWPSTTTALSSPSQVFFNFSEDIDTSWTPNYTGEEVNLSSLI
jgi:hypothetical protein